MLNPSESLHFLKLLFWGSILMLFYVYAGYPILVFLLATLRKRKVKKGSYEPKITVLIPAFNEAENIEETLRNKINLVYPKEKLEIIVISDGSTDDTDKIVGKYEKSGVKLIRQDPRSGKTVALNMAVPQASGEILVFSDANSIYEADALQRLAENFNDPEVGYVTGKMIYTMPNGNVIGDGCSVYMRYENVLRKLETNIGSIIGVDGGIDAVRKELYQPMNPDQLPDFVLPLRVLEQGYRVVYEPDAILYEPSLEASDDEYKMRVRVSLRSLWALKDMRRLLSLSKFRMIAWQVWSHKVLRYFCFVFLIGTYLANAGLWSVSVSYKLLFILQNLGYAVAILFPILHRMWRPLKILYPLNYFTLLNLAATHAFLKFLMGQKQVIWTPRRG